MTARRALLRFGWATHRMLWALSGHRIGTKRPGAGVGTMFLVTTGRRSGATRRNALFYIEDGNTFVVVGSNGGAGVDPAWWKNLQASPDAAIELGRRFIPVRARLADETERARLWSRLVAANPPYQTYQAARSTDIPVVLLEPRG